MRELMINEDTNAELATDTSSDAWYTPKWLVDNIREILGSIDTDPMSCDVAQTIVKAQNYYTKENSGLDKEWYGNVFMNPPYSRELYPVAIDYFLDQYHYENIANGIVLTRNNTETKSTQKLLHQCDNALFFNKRIVFWNPDKASEQNPDKGGNTDKCGHIMFLFSQDLTAQFLFKRVLANQGFFLR